MRRNRVFRENRFPRGSVRTFCALLSVPLAGLCLLAALAAFSSARGAPPDSAQIGEAASQASAGYSILIETQQKKLYLLQNGRFVKSYLCAIGKPETPSPLGSFQIVQKAHWGEGFGGYWLGLNCPWGNYGIHGTLFPESVGSSASHGCFRMFNDDVRELYGIVPVGTPVLVTGGNYGAFGSGFRLLSPGMYGQDVLAVQKRLQLLGYYTAGCDGRFGPALLRAVHRFERDSGLPVSDTIDRRLFSAMGFVLME